MDKDQFIQVIQEIGTIEDDAERRNKLTELQDSITTIFDTNDTLTQENNKYIEENKKLQDYNMQLFLRVGNQKAQEPNDGAVEDGDPKEPRKFEDLFNEKGGLK